MTLFLIAVITISFVAGYVRALRSAGAEMAESSRVFSPCTGTIGVTVHEKMISVHIEWIEAIPFGPFKIRPEAHWDFEPEVLKPIAEEILRGAHTVADAEADPVRSVMDLPGFESFERRFTPTGYRWVVTVEIAPGRAMRMMGATPEMAARRLLARAEELCRT